MQFARPLVAVHPSSFGRGRARVVAFPRSLPSRMREDIRLFATTFAVGFLFVSILIS
jgi:hypothetical protein